MIYITLKKPPKAIQFSFEDMLFGVNPEKFNLEIKDTHDTRTYVYESTPQNLLEKVDIINMIQILEDFCIRYAELIGTEDKSTLYRSFKIPKRSGGLRQINAPEGELMTALRELKFILEQKLYANYHTTAFAYIKGRSTIDAVKRHQQNKSRWFLKLDFHDFFGSTTLEFVMKQMETIFPFNEILKSERGRAAIKSALSLCFLNGGLPQGTPISPTLTNLMMIPFDHQLAKAMREHTPHICYTRYADDLLLSSDLSFKWTEVQQQVIDLLKQINAPFQLNTSKTRYGSSAGRNWNLGVMLNKDNEITIGHSKKKLLKAMLYNFMNDYTNNRIWNLEDVQVLNGQISYYKMVEKENIEQILNTYSNKFNLSVMGAIKQILTHNVMSNAS